jgi:glycosyltransferase involved in cell wall biosynthesis
MHILIPRFVDRSHIRAQELSLKSMLPFFSTPGHRWTTFYHHEAEPAVAASPNVRLRRFVSPMPPRYAGGEKARGGFLPVKLRNSLSKWELPLRYLSGADAIFYPDARKPDALGLRLRKALRKEVPLIATLEGLVGDETRQRHFSKSMGYEIFLDKSAPSAEWIYAQAGLIIAISPLLARLARDYYNKPVITMPLGHDDRIYLARGRQEPEKPLIVSAGTLNDRKRPEVFIKLAEAFPEADFIWFGNGAKRVSLEMELGKKGITNLSFPGTTSPEKLAETYRNASFHVLPSRSEGVPKVTQESLACGLPAVIFGNYGAPNVTDGVNGFVVWSDDEMLERTGRLLQDATLRRDMSQAAAEMASKLSWRKMGPQWEKAILDYLGGI